MNREKKEIKKDKKETSEQDNVRDRSENGRGKSRSRSGWSWRKRETRGRSSSSSCLEKSENRKFWRNLSFVTERCRELDSSQNSSEANHAKLCFNSFFLYSAGRRPELSDRLRDSEKFDRLLE